MIKGKTNVVSSGLRLITERYLSLAAEYKRRASFGSLVRASSASASASIRGIAYICFARTCIDIRSVSTSGSLQGLTPFLKCTPVRA